MRLLLTVVTVFCLNNEVFSQWNFQLAHEYGVSRVIYSSTPIGKDTQNNQLHRTTTSVEYQFDNGLLLALNGGSGWHLVDYSYERENIFSGIPTTDNRNMVGKFQNYRAGISLGYLFDFNKKSHLGLMLSYDQFFVNKISIEESNHTINANNESNNEPEILVEEFDPLVDLEEIGYRNELIKKNGSLSLSLSYRHQFDNNFFVSPSIIYSLYNNVMWNNPALIEKRNHVFLVGVSLGYIFPQKDKQDEK